MARSYARTHTPRASHQAQNARRRAFRTIVHSGVGTDGKRRIVSRVLPWMPASGEVHCMTIRTITGTLRPAPAPEKGRPGLRARRQEPRQLALAPVIDCLSQLPQQRFGVPNVGRVESFSKPDVDRCQQIVSVGALALAAPQPREAHGSTQLQRLGVLTTSDGKSLMKTSLHLCIDGLATAWW